MQSFTGQQVSANMCNKHQGQSLYAMRQLQRRLGDSVVVVVVVVESSPLLTGRTWVENRMTSIRMPMITSITTTQMIVQRVLRHHILRRTRWDVFLNVAAFTAKKTKNLKCTQGEAIAVVAQWCWTGIWPETWVWMLLSSTWVYPIPCAAKVPLHTWAHSLYNEEEYDVKRPPFCHTSYFQS